MIHDEVAARLRSRLEMTGCPGLGGTRRLVEHLSPALRYVADPDRRMAVCVCCPGSVIVKAPPNDAELLAYEVGQALRDAPQVLAAALGTAVLPERLHGEWNPAAFARAWLLPVEVLSVSEHDLAPLAGCAVETVRIRRLEAEELGSRERQQIRRLETPGCR